MTKKTLKESVSKCFANLRKFGYEVYNSQDNYRNPMPKGLKGISDYIIVGHGYLFFAEVKFIETKDKYSPEQLTFKEKIKYVSHKNPFVFYVLINENNYKDFYTDILQQNYKKLKSQC